MTESSHELTALVDLESRCPAAILRGNRIVRMSEKRIGRFLLDYQTLFELGTDNVGVLVGGTKSPSLFSDQLCKLREMDLDGTIVVATASNQLANSYYSRLAGTGVSRRRPDVFSTGAITLTTPERLRKVTTESCVSRPVLAVVLVDHACVVHKARGGEGSGWGVNDRPQHFVKFRHEHRQGLWQPPMLLMTDRAAKSLNTAQMLAPYGLDAWWFVDAPSLRMGPPPTSSDAPEPSTETGLG